MTYSQYGNCPKCGYSWDAGPIPEKSRKYYGEPYRFSKIIGISSLELNRLTHYECPNCQAEFKRNEITRELPEWIKL